MQIQDNSIVNKRQIYLLHSLFPTALLPKTTGYLSWCPQFPVSYLMEFRHSFLKTGEYLRSGFISLSLMYGSSYKDFTLLALVNLLSLYKMAAFSFLNKCSKPDVFNLWTSYSGTSFAKISVSICGSLSLPRYRSRFGGAL
jgi:hypothetical protein